MGIAVILETEQGSRLELVVDAGNILHRVLPAPEDPTFQWANMIDWYGDTVFNR